MNNSKQATGRSGHVAGLADGRVAVQAGAVVLPRAKIVVGSGLCWVGSVAQLILQNI